MNRFFKAKVNMQLGDIAKYCGIILTDNVTAIVNGIATLNDAGSFDITSYHNAKYGKLLRESKALACFIKEADKNLLPSSIIPLVTNNPYQKLAQAITFLYEETYSGTTYVNGISKDAQIGLGVVVGQGSVIGPGVIIGDDTRIGHNVVITHAEIGANCQIESGVIIGSEGFGFDLEHRISVPQVGSVKIGNRVSIGANTTIDRGSLQDTTIGDGCRIDNLVQIAHNVQLGSNVVVVSQTGIAGSTRIGDNTVIAGQVGIVGHIDIGKNVMIAARSGVVRSVADHSVIGGAPAVPIEELRRQIAAVIKLGKKA